MANAFQVTQKVADLFLPAFYGSFALLDVANTELAAEYQNGMFGIGESVQIRKKARYLPGSITLPSTGALSLTIDNIQQETETLTIDEFLYIPIQLNAIEQSLNMRTENAIMEEFIYPGVQSLKKQVMNKIYTKFLRSAYITSNSANSVINSHSQLADCTAVMTSLQMELDRQMHLSPRDGSQLRPTLGAYYQPVASKETLLRGVFSALDSFGTMVEDDTIRLHTGGTASTNTVLTLSIAAVNGATTLTIANLVVGQTIIVGDVITMTDNDVNFVSPIDKETVETAITQVSFVAAVGTTLPDYNTGTATYTATATTMEVQLSNPVRTAITTDHFAYIQGNSSDEIPAGEALTISASHRANMAISSGGISIAAPPVSRIVNSEFAIQSYKGINIMVARQGNLTNLTNTSIVGLQIGVKIHPEYCVRLMSGG